MTSFFQDRHRLVLADFFLSRGATIDPLRSLMIAKNSQKSPPGKSAKPRRFSGRQLISL
jgi:hypothetical protein